MAVCLAASTRLGMSNHALRTGEDEQTRLRANQSSGQPPVLRLMIPSTSTSGPHQRIRTSWASARRDPRVGPREAATPRAPDRGTTPHRAPEPARAPVGAGRPMPAVTEDRLVGSTYQQMVDPVVAVPAAQADQSGREVGVQTVVLKCQRRADLGGGEPPAQRRVRSPVAGPAVCEGLPGDVWQAQPEHLFVQGQQSADGTVSRARVCPGAGTPPARRSRTAAAAPRPARLVPRRPL